MAPEGGGRKPPNNNNNRGGCDGGGGAGRVSVSSHATIDFLISCGGFWLGLLKTEKETEAVGPLSPVPYKVIVTNGHEVNRCARDQKIQQWRLTPNIPRIQLYIALLVPEHLGLHLETLQPNSPYPLPPFGYFIPGTAIKDLLLVSVDVDTGGGYETISSGQSFHIGISTESCHTDTQGTYYPTRMGKMAEIIWLLDSFEFSIRNQGLDCQGSIFQPHKLWHNYRLLLKLRKLESMAPVRQNFRQSLANQQPNRKHAPIQQEYHVHFPFSNPPLRQRGVDRVMEQVIDLVEKKTLAYLLTVS
jgi:hypothetical protein